MTPQTETGLCSDLLRIEGVRNLVRSRLFPYVPQAVALGGFAALVVAGWRVAPLEGVDGKLFAKSNAVTLAVWGLWWPAMIWLTVLAGRVWCTVCPLEFVSNVTERAARRIGVQQRRLPRMLAGGAFVAAAYGLIQMLVAGLKIHRSPAATSMYLLVLLAGAGATAVIFRDRAFCRGFCPVSLLLSVYGRLGSVAVRCKSTAVCASCTEHSCVAITNRYALDGRSCPSLLNPQTLDESTSCLLCTQCVKACDRNNLALQLRGPASRNDRVEPSASRPVTAFVMMVSGFVVWELAGELGKADEFFLAVPDAVIEATGAAAAAGFVRGFWAVVVFPLLAWTIAAAALKGRRTLTEAWRAAALPVGTVVAAGHMVKALAKLNSWAPFIPRVIADPSGRSASAIASGAVAAPHAFLGGWWILAAGVAIIATGVAVAIRQARPSR